MAHGSATALESGFGIACCKLLARYPLYRYCKEGPDGKELAVLLVGTLTDSMWSLLGEILANGQLLDTRLQVTLASLAAEADRQTLGKKAPALHRFIDIDGGTAEWSLGGLSIMEADPAEAVKTLATAYRYVIICTGDAGENARLAADGTAAPGAVLAWVDGDSIRVRFPAEERLSGVDEREKDEFLREIHPIAHNLHFCYKKGLNPRDTRESIRRGYFDDGYNRHSDLEAALHVRSKLACCGILEQDLGTAAALFAEKLSREPELEARLAELEHRRWCVSKLMQGYRPGDVSAIYRGGNGTHSSREKWHTILVPYGRTRPLTKADWSHPDPDALRDLDPLDRQTLRIHKRCGELTRENEQARDEALDALRLHFIRHADSLRNLQQEADGLIWAVGQLWQGKRSVIPVYNRCLRALEIRAAEKPGDGLKERLTALKAVAEPQIEYVICKDYKAQNALLVRQIPFALTHKQQIVLVKLMADKETDCLFSPWQLEPKRVVYVDLAETWQELQAIRGRAERINTFLDNNQNGITRQYHVLVPRELMQPDPVLKLYPVDGRGEETIREVFRGILNRAKLDYIDLTGGNPILTCLARAQAADSGIGAFYVRGGRMRNFCNARELEYDAPVMDLTVKEMFDQSGAVLNKSDSSQMSDITAIYQRFWETALAHRDAWDGFCKTVSRAYRTAKPQKYPLKALGKDKLPTSGAVVLGEPLFRALIPIFCHLRGNQDLTACDVRREPDGRYRVDFTIRGKKRAEGLAQTLEELERSFCPGMVYDLYRTKTLPVITSQSLRVERMELPEGRVAVYREILKDLHDSGVILDLAWSAGETVCTFRFSSRDIQSAMRNSGKVLEYYIYYTALLECGFDDVDMSWFFAHSKKSGAAMNEVDVICTRGTGSLFISAKNVRRDAFETDNFLNYVCYEISLLADHFGINARRVLVAPDIPHFENGSRSDKVRRALSRDVYLVGRECCRDGHLGSVLRKIAAGDPEWDRF